MFTLKIDNDQLTDILYNGVLEFGKACRKESWSWKRRMMRF